MILHIAKAIDWDNALKSGKYTADTLLCQGFIHCSTSTQIIEVANCLFKHQKGLKLLVIEETKLESEIRYENTDGTELFTHVYGPINTDAVVNALDFDETPKGFILPDILSKP